MSETKQQVTQRKIRNGLRKQELAHKMKVWNILKTNTQIYSANPFEFSTVSAMTSQPYAAPPINVITHGSAS
jgi:hypothetical protein